MPEQNLNDFGGRSLPVQKDNSLENDMRRLNLIKSILFGLLAGLIACLVTFLLFQEIIISLTLIIVLPILSVVVYFIFDQIKSSSKPKIESVTKGSVVLSKELQAPPIMPSPLNISDDVIKQKQNRKKTLQKIILFGLIAGLILGILTFLIYKSWYLIPIMIIFCPIFFYFYDYFKRQLERSARIRKIETVFPDFLQLMSSNLRAGMTVDRSLFLSAREEFNPLDLEIQKAGKDITTGKTMEQSLIDLSKRIGSEKVEKVIFLIISGIRAGGNLAMLLEETSANMREKDFVEKRAASNVMMYVIFIFITVSAGAPALFSLSSILVEILSELLSNIPTVSNVSVPFTMSAISISVTFIKVFCVVFIIATDILASLTLGLVSKGEEKEGLKYLLPLIAISISVFFIIRYLLAEFMSGLFR